MKHGNKGKKLNSDFVNHKSEFQKVGTATAKAGQANVTLISG